MMLIDISGTGENGIYKADNMYTECHFLCVVPYVYISFIFFYNTHTWTIKWISQVPLGLTSDLVWTPGILN